MWLDLTLWAIIFYSLFFIILPMLLLPGNYLIKVNMNNLNREWKKVINKLNKIKDKEKFTKASYTFIAERYPTKRFRLPIYLYRMFWHNPNEIIKFSGYVPCNIHSFMLKKLLLASKRFKEEDIKEKYTITDFLIHKYIRVNINGKYVNLDSWGKGSGVPYGSYARGFGYV